jgi:hypothetical protein
MNVVAADAPRSATLTSAAVIHEFSGTGTPAFRPGRKCRSLSWGLPINECGVEYCEVLRRRENPIGRHLKFNVSRNFELLPALNKRFSFGE